MPITSPSYFPPSRANGTVVGITAGRNATGAANFLGGQSAGDNSTIANLVVIGDNSGKGGITDANLAGSVIVGASSGQLFTAVSTVTPNTPGSVIIIGTGTLNAATKLDATIAIGQGIAPSITGSASQNITGNILVGNGISAGAGTNPMSRCIVIGHGAQGMSTGAGTSTDLNVVIGYNAAKNNNSNLTSDVIIGGNAGLTVGNGAGGINSQNVIIGALSDASAYTNGAVIIGYQAKCNASVAGLSNSIGIGINTQCGATTDLGGNNIVIGSQGTIPVNTVNGGNVCIGPGVGRTFPAGAGSIFCIENNLVSQAAIFYGSFATGNLIIGASQDAVNRDFGGVPGTNIVKLINGTKSTGANSVGGGYFYGVGGFLHWVDTNGVDTQLSVTVAGQLVANGLAAYTNNAAAQIATITNGPTAGNPTKWIPINDNGTIRNIPAW